MATKMNKPETTSNFWKNAVDGHIHRILAVLQENLSRSNQLQQSFLEHQAQTLQTIAAYIGFPNLFANTKSSERPVITKTQLEEFGTGSIAKCFGPDFEILDQRKSPRIPNGDLLMIDRVLMISGERGNLNSPASITTEFEVPKNVWFINENKYPGIPLAILMEITLQPCGILSAYLGASLSLPADVNLFRNLDGMIFFHSCPDLCEQTVTNHSKLLMSVLSGGMLIQKFAFELSTDRSVFLAGESSFGYFRQTAMDKQTGMDIGEKTMPEISDHAIHGDYQQVEPISIFPRGNPSTKRHLDLIDRLQLKEKGGRYGHGIIIGEKKLSGKEWFYENHFFQDPVMPGSLGIEAIVQGLWAFVKHFQLDKIFHNPVVDFSHSDPLNWKYRGQVIPANSEIYFEVHLKSHYASDTTTNLLGDADFWVDGTRIYSIQNISMTLREG
jgi:3-hydroxymyristoyl/3-hydroxydecanoyl-(acyl carrier protein) dehydratase